MKHAAALFFILLAVAGLQGAAAAQPLPDEVPAGYVADITLQSEEQLVLMLERAEQMLNSGELSSGDQAAVTFVLHGPVLYTLLRQNYTGNKRLVDLAARLSAMNVIDVKACNTWMSGKGITASALQPFVESVPYGPGLVQELVREKRYVVF